MLSLKLQIIAFSLVQIIQLFVFNSFYIVNFWHFVRNSSFLILYFSIHHSAWELPLSNSWHYSHLSLRSLIRIAINKLIFSYKFQLILIKFCF